jgi:hypothetical protein
MATNAAKTFMCNLAVSKTKAGLTDVGQNYVNLIDDSYFTDYLAVMGSSQNETVKRLCLYYETVLKQCLLDMRPDFAKRFADLGLPIAINKPIADWQYLFDVPSDYLALLCQLSQTRQTQKYDARVLDFTSYAHVVKGSDGLYYYCIANVTGAALNTPITGGSYATYWTATTDYEGIDFEVGRAYKSANSGKILVTNTLSNNDGDSAYIEYLAYVQGGISDDPTKYPEGFKNAMATRLAVEIEVDYDRRVKLLQEYELLAKPFSDIVNNMAQYQKPVTKVLDARSALNTGE